MYSKVFGDNSCCVVYHISVAHILHFHSIRLKVGALSAERDICQFVPFRKFSHVSSVVYIDRKHNECIYL